jgi:hypothetical protein
MARKAARRSPGLRLARAACPTATGTSRGSGRWRDGGRQRKAALGPVRPKGSRDGLTRNQAEAPRYA